MRFFRLHTPLLTWLSIWLVLLGHALPVHGRAAGSAGLGPGGQGAFWLELCTPAGIERVAWAGGSASVSAPALLPVARLGAQALAQSPAALHPGQAPHDAPPIAAWWHCPWCVLHAPWVALPPGPGAAAVPSAWAGPQVWPRVSAVQARPGKAQALMPPPRAPPRSC